MIVMITILVLSGSSLQVVIVYHVENQYAKACMNYGLKSVLSENNKNRTKASISRLYLRCHMGRCLEHQILISLQAIPSFIDFQVSDRKVALVGYSRPTSRSTSQHQIFRHFLTAMGDSPYTKFNFQNSQL